MAKDFKNALKGINKETSQEEPKTNFIAPESINDKSEIELLILDSVNDSKESSYTLKAPNEFLMLVNALATAKKMTIKEFYIEALKETLRTATKEEINKALFFKKEYMK